MNKDLRLGVNIDHVATLRQARRASFPDPVEAAFIAERAGADGITVHLREDRRHIQERDLDILLSVVVTKVNLEMAVTPEMVETAVSKRPRSVCLVPERREEITTEGGLDVASSPSKIASATMRLREAGIAVSHFIDPEPRQVAAAREAGASHIELHTGAWAGAFGDEDAEGREKERLILASRAALDLGLRVNAGHGLDYRNVGGILDLPGLEELNIGFSIIARAVMTGLDEAVREMIRLLRKGRPG